MMTDEVMESISTGSTNEKRGYNDAMKSQGVLKWRNAGQGGQGNSALTPSKKSIDVTLKEALCAVLYEEVEVAIQAVCVEMNIFTKDKETDEEKPTTFALSYLYNNLIMEQLTDGIQEVLTKGLGKKKVKASLKEISAATLFNYNVELSFSEPDLERFVAWCRSQSQLKLWKALWFNWMAKVNDNLRKKGYTGRIYFPRGFYKLTDALFIKTHAPGYQPLETPQNTNSIKLSSKSSSSSGAMELDAQN